MGNKHLKKSILDKSHLNHAEKLNNVLLEITKAVNTILDLNDLFQFIHQSLNSVLDANNFYIALTDTKEKTAKWLYFVDELRPGFPGQGFTVPLYEGSLTLKLIKKGELQILKKNEILDHFNKFQHQVGVDISEVWVGIPFIIKGEVIGMMAVQNYSDGNTYNEQDIEFLKSASNQIATLFDRKSTIDQLKIDDNKYRKLIENIKDAIYSTDFIGRVSYISPIIKTITGYSPNELCGKLRWHTADSNELWSKLFVHPEDREYVEASVKKALDAVSQFEIEYRIIKKNGKSNWILDQGDFIRGKKGDIRLDGNIKDIQAKKKAELINEALFSISNAVNTTFDLMDLYQKIHASLKKIINVENFYIALYDKNKDILSFLFDTDKVDLKENPDILEASKSNSLTAELIRVGETILFTKDQQIEHANRFGGRLAGVPSELWLGVPLKVKGEVIGAMVTQSYTNTNLYTDKDAAILNSVSDQIAIAIERKQAEEQLKLRESLITSLYHISNAVHATSNLDQLYQSIHSTLENIIDVRNFSIALYDIEKDMLHVKFSNDAVDNNIFKPILNASESSSLTYEVIKEGKPRLFDDKEQLNFANEHGGKIYGVISKSWIGVPLKGKSGPMGAMIIQNYDEYNCYKEKDIHLLTSVSDQIATAIELKQSEEKVKAREKLITTLYYISKAIPTALDIEQLCKLIHEALMKTIPLENFSLALYEKEADRLNFIYRIGEFSTTKVINNASKTCSLTYEVIRCGKMIMMDEQGQKNFISNHTSKMIGGLSKSWLGVPLSSKKISFGAIVTQNYSSENFYSKEVIDLLTAVSEQISFAIAYKKAEAELVDVNKQLIDKAHQAGMAEIATGTLHNVGNLLNSVKTSTFVVSNTIKNSKLADYERANDILRDHIDDIEVFITSDPKGKKLLEYYLKLEEFFKEDQKEIQNQINRLNDNIDNISVVIAAQQNYAGTHFLSEDYTLTEIVDNALVMMDGLLKSNKIEVILDIKKSPVIKLQKTKLIHILINLIKNAKDALVQKGNADKQIKLAIESNQTEILLKFNDNGSGIPKNDLKKIFNHGYTTKKTGYGFGLHSCANYMTEMGGEMWAESEGNKTGTTFVLKFPLQYKK